MSSGHCQETLTLDSLMDSRFSVQPSPLNEVLDLMRSVAITEGSLPNYAQPRLGAESGEFYIPPTTHFITTVEDLTDKLDYGSEDIDGMCWGYTSRYDPAGYMTRLGLGVSLVTRRRIGDLRVWWLTGLTTHEPGDSLMAPTAGQIKD